MIVVLIVMAAGFILFCTAMLQNRFASRIVEIQARQTIIDTGFYAVVRHPMYMALLLDSRVGYADYIIEVRYRMKPGVW